LLSFLGALLATGVVGAEPNRPPATTVTQSVILTVEGTVEVASAANWQPARPQQPLRVGERLRTGRRSRATVRLADLSVIRINELTTFQILPPHSEQRKPLFDLKQGSAYFFSRERPADVEFRTPVIAGAIRGTEFHLHVEPDGATRVSLLDGQVTVSNEHGQQELASGQESLIPPGQPPGKTAVLNARNLIQWCLYYPAVLEPDELDWSAEDREAHRRSIEAYRRGDLRQAAAEAPPDRAAASDASRLYAAALALAVGQVQAAEDLLAGVSASAPLTAALRQMVAAVKFETWTRTHPPALASEWLAESYYLQSRSQLPAALKAARAAAAKAPSFGFAWARVAELEFSFGRVPAAEAALRQAHGLSPGHAQALALQGFLLSARGRFTEAGPWFERAIEADGALGNAWLGRGLCRIRRGEIEAGRQDLQTAAALEPQRALLRSYLAKAFLREGRVHLAEKDLRLAQTLDPNDPTAWLYSALLRQQRNDINQAVRDLEHSQALNDHRQVYRSRLLLDQDRAVRGANLAAAYRDAGLTDVSVREAARAVNADYANSSAHLFLAESYDALRDPRAVNLRYETPWFSEQLVANLLAPVGAGNLSRSISQQEYARFFDGNHLGVFSATEYLSRGAWTQQGAQYGTLGQTSYSLDGYYQYDPGQRANNDLDQLTLGAALKQQITAQDSVLLQAFHAETRSGDLGQYYNYDGQGPAGTPTPDLTQRVRELQTPNLFLGYHRAWAPGLHTLGLAGLLQDDFTLEGTAPLLSLTQNTNGALVFPPLQRPSPIRLESEFRAYTLELQQIGQWGPHTLVAGGRYQTGDQDSHAWTSRSDQSSDTTLTRGSAYAYEYWQVVKPLQLIAGVAYDALDYPENIDVPPISGAQTRKDQVSPKAGFYLTPLDGTVLRGVYTRSLGGLYYDTSVRLEPTQIAGFNQAFRSLIPESVAGLVAGSEFETFGLALDQKFKTGTYVSLAAELLSLEADRTLGAYVTTVRPGVLAPALPGGTKERLEFEEKTLTATVHQLIGKYWAVGGSYRVSRAELEEAFANVAQFNRDVSATLQQAQLSATFNHPCGFFAQWSSLWTQQSNHDYAPDLPGDDFWQHQVQIGYRFAQRRAEVRLGLLNLTDQDYRLNPLTLHAELPRERTLMVSLRFNF
jgi:Tfp pilus assembly protein PilF